MNTGREKCYVQCQVCGKVFQIPQRIPSDKLYISVYCTRCKTFTAGINLGDKEEDRYYFYNVVLDERYYN